MRSQLRLWRPDGDCHPPTPWEHVRWDGSRTVEDAVLDGREVHKGWRLVEFLRRYFGPVWLFGGETPARDGYILAFWDAARWVARVVGDPLLADICEGWFADFQGKLRDATYTRSTVCNARKLSDATRAKHYRQIRALIRELEWLRIIDPMRPPRKSRRRSAPEEPEPKPCYSVPDLRKLVAAAVNVPVQGCDADRRRALWRATIGLGFYTGLRREACLSATWSHVERLGTESWLHVPGALTKTKKRWDGPIYPALLAELEQLRPAGDDRDCKLLPWPYKPDWVLRLVKIACGLAGLGSGKGRDIHGLRRSHTELVLGEDYTAEATDVRDSLDQADESTTFRYYTPRAKLRAKYIRRAPAIW
jgi:integrase